MKSLQEWTESTSAYELFTFLFWKIIDGEIRTFSQLVAYLERIPPSNRKTFVLKNCFLLIRKLYWGFFRDLGQDEYGRLWDVVTVPDRKTGFGADLKENITISNVYAAFIDIHGYTAFCEKAVLNPSMLRLLDESIENDIRSLCRSLSVLARRAHGDEIILIGSSASDIVKSVISVAEYFANRRSHPLPGCETGRTGNSIILPELKISAGISGGRKFTSLLITEDGDLSGTIMNTAARIQSFANKLSGESTRILMSQYVHLQFMAEAVKDPLLESGSVLFMAVGTVAMKGVHVPLVEALTDPSEQYRHRYRGELQKLRESLKKKLWQEQVFLDTVNLLLWVVRCMPPFAVREQGAHASADGNGGGVRKFDSQDASGMLMKAAGAFRSGNEFEEALGILRTVVGKLGRLPAIDRISIQYAREVTVKYFRILESYRRDLRKLPVTGVTNVSMLADITACSQLRPHAAAYRELRARIRSKIDPERKKTLWQQSVNSLMDKLTVRLYFGKK